MKPKVIRCPKCSAFPVRVYRGIVARHHSAEVGKTWCAVTAKGVTGQMIDIRIECSMSGAKASFP